MTDKDTILAFADSLEWQPIETAPYEEQPTGKKLTILLRNKFRVAFGVWDNHHMDYLVDGAMPIQDVWRKTDPILWMPLPTGEAAAVIRDLVEALHEIDSFTMVQPAELNIPEETWYRLYVNKMLIIAYFAMKKAAKAVGENNE